MEVLHFRVDLLYFIYLFIYYHEGAHFITKVHTKVSYRYLAPLLDSFYELFDVDVILAAKKCFEGLSDRNTPRRRAAASKCCHTPTMTTATHFVMTSGGCGGAHITKRRHPARPSAMLPGRLRTAPKTPVNVASRRKCLTVVANVVPQGDALPPPAVFNVSRSVSTDCPYSHDALVKLN